MMRYHALWVGKKLIRALKIFLIIFLLMAKKHLRC
uniref:Uncharacterized protein n=1 Tax=Siphoviridae sp. ctxMM9 TaxID=2827973 RepID=A0A8S5T6B4_9CAUD|nr:MAG TPA: hypothetical protein [Siphoviridae sp. ctxMM9]